MLPATVPSGHWLSGLLYFVLDLLPQSLLRTRLRKAQAGKFERRIIVLRGFPSSVLYSSNTTMKL